MRRFRRRRRRMAAAALLPLAAALTTSAFADTPAEGPSARIDAAQRSVPIGQSVTLRGVFPGASGAAIELRYRPQGASAWHTAAHARTGKTGHYAVRVKPRRIATWRAELVGAGAARDASTGSERIAVRSRTVAKVGGRNAMAGDRVKVKGHVTPAGAKRRIIVRVGGERVATRAGRDGGFQVAVEAPSTGSYPVDVRARPNEVATGSRDSAGRVFVYRPAAASWYGPGLYGNNLACGGTLSPSTMGVANKALPCGTKVHLRYRGKSVTVPVIDRGPYAAGREYDLTAATKEALGFPDVGTVLTTR
jgi:rare lipoprotein A